MRAIERLVDVGKPLSPRFDLVVKHPALFTALAEPLRKRFRLVAIVRDPLAVLASWHSVDVPAESRPIAQGRGVRARPRGCRERRARCPFAPDRPAALAARDLRRLPPGDVIRYEDLTADPRIALAGLTSRAAQLPAGMEAYDVARRYPGVDLASLARALRSISDVAERFYPGFAQTLDRRARSDT